MSGTKRASLLAVVGTGTEVGKTFVSTRLAAAWAERNPARRIAAIKPVESGGRADGEALERVSTFDMSRFRAPYLLAEPVSPHLAARRESKTVELAAIANWVSAIREDADGVLVETAGGLFSPLAISASLDGAGDRAITNAELVGVLAPTHCVLVARNRLGVLHDVISTLRAARSTCALEVDAIVLCDVAAADASSATNAEELRAIVFPSEGWRVVNLPFAPEADNRVLADLLEAMDARSCFT